MKNVSGHCPVCRSKILEGGTHCPTCETPHHKECWEYNGKCAIFACKGKPDPVVVPVQIHSGYGRYLDISFTLLIMPLIMLVLTIVSADRMTVYKGEVVVCSSWINQKNYLFDEGESYYPLFSTTTTYKMRTLFYFSTPVPFSDGIQGNMSGTVEWEMPNSCPDIEWLHCKYGSQSKIGQKLIWNQIISTLTKTGRMMTSVESYADRGAKFQRLFSDQMQNGDYVVMLGDGLVINPITKKELRIDTIFPVTRPYGSVSRDISELQHFGITVSKASVDIGYPSEFRDAMYKIERVQTEYMLQEQELRTKRRAYRKIFTDTLKYLLTFF